MTPAGKPEIAIVTASVNPFLAVVETVKVALELPASAVIVAGDTLMSKSLVPGLVGEGAGPLPQPTKVDNHNAIQTMSKEPERVAGHWVTR